MYLLSHSFESQKSGLTSRACPHSLALSTLPPSNAAMASRDFSCRYLSGCGLSDSLLPHLGMLVIALGQFE